MHLHHALGIERGLAVHVNLHGFDNSVDLDAVARSGGKYFAVVRLDGTASREACRALHESGARGVRFAFNPAHGGTLDVRVFEHVMRCIEGLGWFVELHFAGQDIPKLYPWIAQISSPVVIDHFGNVDIAAGTGDENFGMIVDLAQRKNVWVKITCADRLTKVGYPFHDVRPFAEQLTNVAASRLLWGTDWPHIAIFDKGDMPDDADLVDSLAVLLPDEAVRKQVLVDNPERLLNLK